MSSPSDNVNPLAAMGSALTALQCEGLLVPTAGLEVIIPSVEFVGDPPDGEAIMRHLEGAIRTAYKSEDRIGPDSHTKIISQILSLKHESTLEHTVISFRAVTSRGVTHELVRHRIACLAGDSLIKFDLPAGQKNGRRVHSVRLDDLARRWTQGSSMTSSRKKKPTMHALIDPSRVYTAKELATLTGRGRGTIGALVRAGYLKGSKEPVETTSPNKWVLTILGSDWVAYALKETTCVLPQKKLISQMALRMCDEVTGEILSTSIKDICYSGVKLVYKVTLDNGYFLKMSRDHRVLTSDGWMPLHEAVNLCGSGAEATFAPRADRLFAVNGYPVGSLLNKLGDLRGMKLSEKGRQCLGDSKRGSRNPHWKGGATPQRAKIGSWTTKQAPSVHLKYDYTCQLCGERGGKLQAHHIDPVYHNIHKAYDIDNLLCVHGSCHKQLESHHLELELLKIMEQGGSPFDFWRDCSLSKLTPHSSKRPKKPNHLVRDWASVVSVDFAGEEETYDISVMGPYHNFVANGFIVHNSYTQESTRYVNYSKRPPQVILPWHLVERSDTEQAFWFTAQQEIIQKYQDALQMGWKPQDARGFLPNDLKTEIVFTMNLRSLRHFLKLRCAPSAHPDMQVIARRTLDHMQGILPLIFADIV